MKLRGSVTGVCAALIIVVGGGIGWLSPAATAASGPAKAYFAGGCFWCMEEAFEKVDGVLSAVSGYMGGTAANPTYEQVSAGKTGHAESVEVTYDPAKVSYQKLLDAFWHNVDPLTPNAQFCDHGTRRSQPAGRGTRRSMTQGATSGSSGSVPPSRCAG